MSETYFEIEFTNASYGSEWRAKSWKSFIWIHPAFGVRMPKHFDSKEEAMSWMDGLRGHGYARYKPVIYRVVKITREVVEE